MPVATEISVVIPVFCEAGHLRTNLGHIKKHLDSLGRTYELIVVDDGSTDGTWSEVEALSQKIAGVRAVRLSRNFGKESAISAGLERARGRAVIVMDSDLQHPPELIPEMVRLWEDSGAQVVDAVKTRGRREGLLRQLGGRVFDVLMCKLSAFDLSGASDYKLLDRKVVEAWRGMEERQLFYRGMTEWLGFRHVRLPFEVGSRKGGRTAWSFVALVRLALTALTSFTSFPLHIVTLGGLAFLLAATALGAWTLYRWIGNNAIGGFTTVILLQLVIGSAVMLSLGVIGEYVSQVYKEVKKRPRYVVADTIESATKCLGHAGSSAPSEVKAK